MITSLGRRPQRDTSTVTVAVSTYNHAHYLAEALDSILAQTRPPERILVVDDGSTDATAEVLRRYEAVVEVHVRPHGGLVAARNWALAQTSTRFLLVVDADNRLQPRAVETLLHLARCPRRRAAVFYGARREFGARERVVRPGRWEPWRLSHYNYIDACALLDREVVLGVGGYSHETDYVGHEDWDLWLRLIEHGYRGVHTDEVVFDYRIGDNTLTRQNLQRTDELRRVFRRLHPWIVDCRPPWPRRILSRLSRERRSLGARIKAGRTQEFEEPLDGAS